MDGLGERIQLCRSICEVRGKGGGSQADFGRVVAVQLGGSNPISGATVSRWEAGEFQPDLRTLLAIARVAGVDAGWLAFGDASRAPKPAETLQPHLDKALRALLEGTLAREEEKLARMRKLAATLHAVSREAKRKPSVPPEGG
jgi:transcriptional regulator with XRE-family HTH domain